MESIKDFLKRSKIALIILVVLSLIGYIFHLLDWWEVVGLFILKVGLGVKTAGAKSFATAVARSGGKQALMLTTGGVLLKRFIIDSSSKFIAVHSVSRYKKNIVIYLRYQVRRMIHSTIAQKIKASVGAILGVYGLKFMWLKVIGSVVQKGLYFIFQPLISGLVSFLISSMSVIWNVITFFIQIKVINMFITWLRRRVLGQIIIKYVIKATEKLGYGFNWLNTSLIKIGFDPKHWLIVKSIRFNRWIEAKIYKHLSKHELVRIRRSIYINSRERIYSIRDGRKEVRSEPSPLKKFKEFYRTRIKKNKTWQEKRMSSKEINAKTILNSRTSRYNNRKNQYISSNV